VFDLDGTLADLKHRRHHVERPACSHCGWIKDCDHHRLGVRPKFKPNWDAFHAACVDDTPIPQIIGVLESLAITGAHIWIWSGRSDSVMQKTAAWLKVHCPLWTRLKMRDHGDYTPDDTLKESWLKAMSPEDKARLVMTFDDRDRVVAMWRRNGVVCAQVAPGDF
jgi:phosphoserine phosphatase